MAVGWRCYFANQGLQALGAVFASFYSSLLIMLIGYFRESDLPLRQ
jgi:hypothetical protein